MDAERITAAVEAELGRSRIPGAALAVVLGGNAALKRAFGVANHETGEPMTPSTVFSIQSLTKPVVTTALMQCHERGEFALDDPVARHLPGVIRNEWEAGNPVTVRSLLTHTSGLPTDIGTPGPADGTPLRDFMAAVARTVRAPGDDMVYANWGYDTVGLLVEHFSGTPWDAYVLKHICAPLGMATTAVGAPPAGAAAASGHFRSAIDDRLHAMESTTWPTIPPAAAGAIYSTIVDMARFLAAHLDGGRSILRPETVARMQELQAAQGPTRSGMGLGFRVTYSNGHRLVCHGGDGLGYTNFIGFYPEAGAGIVLTLNRGGAQSARAVIANTVLGMLADSVPPDAAAMPDLGGCEGEYMSTYWDIQTSLTIEEGSPTFTLRDGLVVSDAGEASVLHPAADGRFIGSGGMLHGFEAEVDCTEDGVRLYGGIYPFRFDRVGELQPPDVVEEGADLTGAWSGTVKTPLGLMPAQVKVDSPTRVTISTPLAQDVALSDCSADAGRISGSFVLTVPGSGDMEMYPRLFVSDGRLRGPIYAQGWFGEIAMKADLARV